jgi:hypothetical protein
MKAESDFYNIISAVEGKEILLVTYTVLSVVVIAIRFNDVAASEDGDFVTNQVAEIMKLDIPSEEA